VRRAALLLVLVALSGCTHAGAPPLLGGTPTPTDATPGSDPRFPPLRFGGTVLDALSGQALDDATVILDLAATAPCRNEGILWQQSNVPTTGLDGRFGPHVAERPRTNDFAYFLHVTAPGYAENVTFIGPAEAQGDLGNLTIVLHPDRSVSGTAPPGTVVALDAPGFPRLAAADANGTFEIDHARVLPASFVADLDEPYLDTLAAPANLTLAAPAGNATGWPLQGTVRGPGGAALVADVVARNHNGTLIGAARSSDDGLFTMWVPRTPGDITLQARTADGHYGASLPTTLNGAPATRFGLVARALC
jgi:hypothetical protein